MECDTMQRLFPATLVAMFCLASGCVPEAENEVVIYSALDQEFAAPILSAFSRDSLKLFIQLVD